MRIILFLCTVLLVSACSTRSTESQQREITGTTNPAPTPSYQPPPSLPPAVSRPLDASGYRNRICEILTNEQALALGFPGPPDQSEAPQYISCIRVSENPETEVAWVYSTPELFGKVSGGPAISLGYVKLVTISGQPALEQGTPDPKDIVRYCTIVLGLASDQAIQIDVRDPEGPGGACERATKVAEAIVRNLGG